MLTVKPMSVKPMLSGLLMYMTIVEPDGKIRVVCCYSVRYLLIQVSVVAATGVATYDRSAVKSSAVTAAA